MKEWKKLFIFASFIPIFFICTVYLRPAYGNNILNYDSDLCEYTNVVPNSSQLTIIIDVHKLTLTVLSDNKPFKQYPVGLGTVETPTPVGNWTIIGKGANWGTGFGSRILVLNVPWGKYGIHGTNKPWSVGRYKSHGCIRMNNRDVEELYDLIPVNTSVTIVGNPFGYYLGTKRTLFKGQRGSDVAEIQYKLLALGYYNGKPDGIFGIGTEQAVKSFQKQNNIEISGQVSIEMYKLLGY